MSALLGQMYCSTEGIVRSYRQGVAQRENNFRSVVRHAFTEEVQTGALAFVTALRDHAPAYSAAPFADLNIAARSITAILGRLLLLPIDDELLQLGSLQHDVNMGAATLAPVVDDDFAAALGVTHSFPDLCAAPGPPMWLAGSLATLSPAHTFLSICFRVRICCQATCSVTQAAVRSMSACSVLMHHRVLCRWNAIGPGSEISAC